MPTNFQKYVKQLKKRGLTQKVIAEKLGCGEVYVSQCMHRRGGALGYKYEHTLEMYIKGFEEIDSNPRVLDGYCGNCGNNVTNGILINGKMMCAQCHIPI